MFLVWIERQNCQLIMWKCQNVIWKHTTSGIANLPITTSETKSTAPQSVLWPPPLVHAHCLWVKTTVLRSYQRSRNPLIWSNQPSTERASRKSDSICVAEITRSQCSVRQINGDKLMRIQFTLSKTESSLFRKYDFKKHTKNSLLFDHLNDFISKTYIKNIFWNTPLFRNSGVFQKILRIL